MGLLKTCKIKMMNKEPNKYVREKNPEVHIWEMEKRKTMQSNAMQYET